MYFVYILKSLKDGNNYVGFTDDINRRLSNHNSGKVEATKPRIPFKLIYYEAHRNKKDAYLREKFLKSGWGKQYIKKVLKHYLENGSD